MNKKYYQLNLFDHIYLNIYSKQIRFFYEIIHGEDENRKIE